MIQKIHSNLDAWPDIEIDYPEKITLIVDTPVEEIPPVIPGIVIYYLREPDEVLGMDDSVIRNHHRFHYILTSSEKVMKRCPNAYPFEFGTTWIFNYPFPQKKFQVSTLIGHKVTTEGHRLRHQVLKNKNRIRVPTDFYLSHIQLKKNDPSLKILGPKKEPLFDSQFHICIENVKQKYFFTEKLIDCFQAKTVPIYWGTPEALHYFDPKGILYAKDLNAIVDQCNRLTPETYAAMLPHIEENWKRSNAFTENRVRFKKCIEEMLQKHPISARF